MEGRRREGGEARYGGVGKVGVPTSMPNEPAPGVLKGGSSCQVYGQPLKGLVPFLPLGNILLKGIKGQQLVGSHTGCEPGLCKGWDALDAGIHHLVGALWDAGNDSQHRVGDITPQGRPTGPLHTTKTRDLWGDSMYAQGAQ